MAGPLATATPSSSASTAATRLSKAAFLEAYPAYGYRDGASSPRHKDDDEAAASSHASASAAAAADLPIDRVRQEEFPALHHPRRNPQGVVYLDHAGATLYARSQLTRYHARLQEGLFGNPHSKGPVASPTGDAVEEARALVLSHFHASAEEWSVVFTAGATAALKLAAELFPFRPQQSRLIYAHNSHTSVLGMREVALGAGATFACLPPSAQYPQQEKDGLAAAVQDLLQEEEEDDDDRKADTPTDHLLVLPAECNLSGRKLDLARLRQTAATLRTQAPGHRVTVLLDAAKHAGTSPLDLGSADEGEVDMVCVSFYKLFGFPTGLGCLLVRSAVVRRMLGGHRENAEEVDQTTQTRRRRRYFGGGTVLAAMPQADFRLLRPEPAQQLADGTENYLGIVALKEGFQALQDLGGGMARIQAHTWTLARFCHEQLVGLRHGNGVPVCEMYSPAPVSPAQQGPVLAFNLRRVDGSMVGYTEVEKLAGLHMIQLRTGCFCNPGGCQEALGLSVEDVQAQLAAGHVCWDENDLVEGRPTGAVRVSLGYMSTWEDVTALLHLLDKYFVSKTVALPAPRTLSPPACASPLGGELRLGSIHLYPIKSCGGVAVEAWPIGPTGLLFDREWALVDAQGQALRLNRVPKMRFIKPQVDLERQELIVSAPNMPELVLGLRFLPAPEHLRDVSVCGEACVGLGYRDADGVDEWFSTFLGRPCNLVRASPYSQKRQRRNSGKEGEEGAPAPKEINFSNEAQFLLVSSASVEHLNGLIAQQVDLDYAFCYEGTRSEQCYVTLENFRPNLVVDGGVAHQEDLWEKVELLLEPNAKEEEEEKGDEGRGIRLQVTGPCARCSMVNVDHRAAKDGGGDETTAMAPVLKTLASYRRDKSNIYFGQFLAFDGLVGGHHEGWLRTGAVVHARRRSESE